MTSAPDPESLRLAQDADRTHNWKRWGPYLSERQWGTVREDYSASGAAWDYFPHDHARRRAYRWGEDGLLGFTDRQCRLCFALALWNEKDPILKERLFGLTGPQGNHGEDVKELYFYLDSTPTHSYARSLYKYPQSRFPYEQLLEGNAARGRGDDEYELTDTDAFAEERYFDIFAEYAKAGPNDLSIRITAINRGPEPAPLHILPTLWFRNTWIWGCRHEGCTLKPLIRQESEQVLWTDHQTLGQFRLEIGPAPDGAIAPVLFTENETNSRDLFGIESYTPYTKDAFNTFVVDGDQDAVNPRRRGTKAAPHFRLVLAPGEEISLRLRLSAADAPATKGFGPEFDNLFDQRMSEADTFYGDHVPQKLTSDENGIVRQAYAGLLWSKQFYHYIVEDWLDGDPNTPPPPLHRRTGRNTDWPHMFGRDV
ncbi:MAG: glucosidase, partial [Phycisphaerae bacterium]|nr:glucosidase [Phycisphaerae bacterium]